MSGVNTVLLQDKCDILFSNSYQMHTEPHMALLCCIFSSSQLDKCFVFVMLESKCTTQWS